MIVGSSSTGFVLWFNGLSQAFITYCSVILKILPSTQPKIAHYHATFQSTGKKERASHFFFGRDLELANIISTFTPNCPNLVAQSNLV